MSDNLIFRRNENDPSGDNVDASGEYCAIVAICSPT